MTVNEALTIRGVMFLPRSLDTALSDAAKAGSCDATYWLSHTPSPMGFLNEILGRPADAERPFLLLVVGHPSTDARAPAIERKPLDAIVSWV